jgi:hypothetical protein
MRNLEITECLLRSRESDRTAFFVRTRAALGPTLLGYSLLLPELLVIEHGVTDLAGGESGAIREKLRWR